jgi:short-subunit dehydrogenase
MLERGNQLGKRSGIINVASAAAQSLLKGSSHYCATKAFDDLFTRSLQV